MNPLTNMKNVKKLSEQQLTRFSSSSGSSWHNQYRDSAWIFIGGLPFDLSEGDLICVFSQYGEVVNINLIRDRHSGKSKGYCFLCYEDQRSTDLAVDNLNGISLLKRLIRVDHVANYKVPKDTKHTDTETKRLRDEGCAPKPMPITTTPTDKRYKRKLDSSDKCRTTFADEIQPQLMLPERLPIYPIKKEEKSPPSDCDAKRRNRR